MLSISIEGQGCQQVNDKATASATDLMNANFVADGGTNIMHPLSEVWHFE